MGKREDYGRWTADHGLAEGDARAIVSGGERVRSWRQRREEHDDHEHGREPAPGPVAVADQGGVGCGGGIGGLSAALHLVKAGLDSIPGGGGEILVQRVRDQHHGQN